MKRIVILSALTLSLLGGVASADRHRGGHWNNRGDRGSVRWNGNVGWSGGVRVTAPVRFVEPRRMIVHRQHVVRRPIFVQRPVVNVRYYNYQRRPALLVENYAAMDGYLWMAGSWSWNGYEWYWTAGHYEPDPNYDAQYDDGYDGQYSDDGYGY